MKYKKEIKKMIPWMLLSFCIYFLGCVYTSQVI